MVMLGRGRSGVGDPEITDSERRHADAIKFGTVEDVDYGKARVRVLIGDKGDPDGHLVTGWLPMAGGRAKGDSDWHPLEKGEEVMVLSESGELQNGMVLPAARYTDENPAPGNKAGLWRKSFQDGATIEYDRETGAFAVASKASAALRVGETSIVVTDGTVTITAGGTTLTISGDGVASSADVSVTGTLTASEDAVGGGKSLKGHKHSGVQTGGGQTGLPA